MQGEKERIEQNEKERESTDWYIAQDKTKAIVLSVSCDTHVRSTDTLPRLVGKIQFLRGYGF